MKKLLTIAVLTTAAFGAEGFKLLNKIKIGGTGGWDYLTLDPVNRRLYASHTAVVEVVDPDAGKVVGQITDLHGVHGIAVVPELNRGFITNGQSNSVTVFDLKTLQKTGEPATGKNPDAICYEPKTRHIFAINHGGGDATVIDPKNNEVLKTFPIGRAPEFCVVDGSGKIYVNIEETSEIVEIDAVKNDVTRRVSLAPAKAPTGLAIDVKNKKLFAVCTRAMVIVDIPRFNVVASAPIGPGTDGGGFDPGLGLAFSSNGGDGTMSIVKLVNGKYETVDTVATARGARTMTVDEKLHRIYLPAAEFGPAPEAKEGQKKGRQPVLPDSFGILVVGK